MNERSTPSEGFVKTLPPNGRLVYRPGWLNDEDSGADPAHLFERLLEDVDWESRTITMFGRRVEQPRKIAFQGDAGVIYRYSNDDYVAARWHPAVRALRDRLEREWGTRFNSVLMNLYRDGRDGMGWHADDEPELGPRPEIASISLGQVRRFLLRSRADPSEKIELQLASGSLLLMGGDLQQAWQHQVPKTARKVGPRINLTFRRILRPAA